MGIFSDYKAYKKYEPQYALWKDDKDKSEAKKLEYLKKNPVDEKTKQEEIQRGKALLRAIDVMDEYSQSRAENMEIATQQVMGVANTLAQYAGVGLGFLTMLLPPVRKGLDVLGNKFPKIGRYRFLIPPAIGFLASIGAIVSMQGWAASKEVGASRKGRFEAMRNELSDPKNFAVLNEEQVKKQEEIAAKIPTTKDMKKGIRAKNSSLLNLANIGSIYKEMIGQDVEDYKAREEFDKKLHAGEDFKKELSEKDTLQAKKDQQLLHNIVEKIDTASQDYAENVELATQTLISASMAGGGLVGWVTNLVVKAMKVQNKFVKGFLPFIVGGGIAIGFSMWAASIQKQASRVGRFLAKKDIEKNLDNFIYVDEEKTKDVRVEKIEKKEKPGFFKFMIQMFKDNREFKKYNETEGVKNIKRSKALKDIELTEEQLKDAKRLQKNTFKTFNKLDEKSQQYAESVEAVGEVVNIPVSLAGMAAGTALGGYIGKLLTKQGSASRIKVGMVIGALAGIIPGVINNIYFTKEQKKASRVAHMLALDEMKDYKKYVDYENLSEDSNKPAKNTKSEEKK
ncbi:MAG: hypothetical protein K6A44_00485 [bacterium]|nr:hypothetical protein [bacterium]